MDVKNNIVYGYLSSGINGNNRLSAPGFSLFIAYTSVLKEDTDD
jgi:hypothetical protein